MTLVQKIKLALRNKIKITGQHSLQIAPGARLRNCDIRVKGHDNRLLIADNVRMRDVLIEIDGNHCELVIGKESVIGNNCYLSVREQETHLHIGEACMLSRNVKIMASDGHNILRQGKRINPARSITIGDNVWLADNVTILKGVSIGSGCVVGINATLTKDIAANQIAAGNPAKVVTDDIEWQKELSY